MFVVATGPCSLSESGRCVGRPSGFDGLEQCTIRPTTSTTLTSCPIFDIQTTHIMGHDDPAGVLRVNGIAFTGTSCPTGMRVNTSTEINWASDDIVRSGGRTDGQMGTGWVICAQDRDHQIRRHCASDPCLNGGQCVDAGQGSAYTCICTNHWSGENCGDCIGYDPEMCRTQVPTFVVHSGPCTVENGGRCVGRPNGYGGESCAISITMDTTLEACPIFSTERCENFGGYCPNRLLVDGTTFADQNCPIGTLLTTDSTITWWSDGSYRTGRFRVYGWEICAVWDTMSAVGRRVQADREIRPAQSTDDSCRYAADGECDEPRYCAVGTDCSDCGGCVTAEPATEPLGPGGPGRTAPSGCHELRCGSIPDWNRRGRCTETSRCADDLELNEVGCCADTAVAGFQRVKPDTCVGRHTRRCSLYLLTPAIFCYVSQQVQRVGRARPR
eukprot:SAG31_NODE_745_length_12408_cov_4.755057_6_plen_443_part_00